MEEERQRETGGAMEEERKRDWGRNRSAAEAPKTDLLDHYNFNVVRPAQNKFFSAQRALFYGYRKFMITKGEWNSVYLGYCSRSRLPGTCPF
jgi:hypothetical protein